jgi:hypothetical protein
MTADGRSASTGKEGPLLGRDAGAIVPDDAPVLQMDKAQFDHTGHMILTYSKPALLIDPTFRQFTRGGLPDIVLVGTIQTDEPARGWITIPFPPVIPQGEVTYFFDPANSGWQNEFSYVMGKWAESGIAAAVSDHVAASRWSDTLTFTIPWDERPGR